MSAAKLLILGLGESGLAMARHCLRQGQRVRVADSRAEPPGLAALRSEGEGAQFCCGFDAALLEGITHLYKSPGLSPHDAQIAPLLSEARARKLFIGAELDLFAQALAVAQPQARVLAVTGTNGKTTVTALTTFLLKAAGIQAQAAGNISPSMLDALHSAQQSGALPEVWVLELSSFQLQDAANFAPHAATCLNITPDHLDWHSSLEEYRAAKLKIFAPHTHCVLPNALEEDWTELLRSAPAKTPKRTSRKAAATRGLDFFGIREPQQAGGWGIVRRGETDWLSWGQRHEDQEEGWLLRDLLPAEELQLLGNHNRCNALAALALATQVPQAHLAPMLRALPRYAGEPHRTQKIAAINGVHFIDDSKGTNIGATLAALKGLSAGHEGARLHVILGGQGKGQDFAPLAQALPNYARSALLIGEAAVEIEEAIRLNTRADSLQTLHCQTLEIAVTQAQQLARSGDVVLLSPACASFDQFRNYAHRGEIFAEQVRALPGAQP